MSAITPYTRSLNISFPVNPIKGSGAAFLWGPRQTGKTTLLKHQFPNAFYLDLLDSDLATELQLRPKLFREKVNAHPQEIVIVDEIQKVPQIIDEVHWLLENTCKKILLCGSSARKLKRDAHNLLGGRALEYTLFPLSSKEIGNVDLNQLLNAGSLPVHYLISDFQPMLKAYVRNYIREEVMAESLTRNIPAFSRFLEIAAMNHGQLLNYTNVAQESGVAANTVRGYYQILLDTLLGFELMPWRKRVKRRVIETAKFYYFDIGVAHALLPESPVLSPGSDLYGRAFEHFIINEVRAYLGYSQHDQPLAFWRTTSGFEVDLIVGDGRMAIECKSGIRLSSTDLKAMRVLQEEMNIGRSIVVTRENQPRTTDDGIEILPWEIFCQKLWQGELIR